MGVGRGWWRCVYANEFFVLLPVLTWWTIRHTFDQRVVDVVRTLPTIYFALLAAGVLPFVSLWTAAVLVHWVLWNACMYHLDKQREAKYVFGQGSQLLVAVALLSPSAFLTGSPSFWTGVTPSALRHVCVAANVVAGVYLAASLLFTKPYSDAWLCYPHPRHLNTLRWGYCPQAYGGHWEWGRTACKYIDNLSDNARCNVHDRGRSLHEEASGVAHVLMEVLAVSLSCYVLQIPRVIEEMRTGSCFKQE